MGNEFSTKLTTQDRRKAKILLLSPMIVPLLLTIPLPLVFFVISFFTTFTFLFVAVLAFGIGAFLSIPAVIFLLVYRKTWLKSLRERLAMDGITANEVEWFKHELKTSERKALKEMEKQNALLADAYKETLASRLTASRVVETAKRELLLVERRINKANYMKGVETQKLLEELAEDRERLTRIKTEGKQLEEDAKARLQMIEATARRTTSWSEIETSLHRLNASRDHVPLALELAKIEKEIRDDVQKELLTGSEPKQLETPQNEESTSDIFNDSLTSNPPQS